MSQIDKVWEYESKGEDSLASKVKKNPDIVMTSPEMASYLIGCMEWKEGDVVMEPCRGKGAFYNALPDSVERRWCEINEGLDYLEYTGEVDVTLSNPPFVPRALFWRFNQKAMETTRREIGWLINISALNVFTPKRLEEMKEKGWYIQSFRVVSDKRWFGRYVWVKITKEPSEMMTWSLKGF
jgi:hypothetical protein